MTADEALRRRVAEWIAVDPDPTTQAEAASLLHSASEGDAASEQELRDAFAGRLSFGTAGLRAQLGPGPARMNRVVIAQTSAGFAAYLTQRATQGLTSQPASVVIGYDARVNSEIFARDAAEIMSGAGITVTLLPEPLPTPVTAFAVRHLGVSAGVMITASHNPPQDNGYKVYLGDEDAGSQIIPPVDHEIATQIALVAEHPFDTLPRAHSYTVADDSIRDAYVSAAAQAVVHGIPRDPQNLTEPLAHETPLRIVYTALHGVGSALTRQVLAAAGLPEVVPVAAQDQPDGTFPTIPYPNPEEPQALDLAFGAARDLGADLVVAHDPDADRLAIAVPDPVHAEGYRRLSGNELGLLLGWRAAEREHQRALAAGDTARGALACTIVSSPALRAVANHYGLDYVETLSGFKWVSRVPNLLFGFEEAIGYLTHPDVVHDKDGVLASADAIALVRECVDAGKTVWQLLDEASMTFGHFASAQVVVRLESMAAVNELSQWVRDRPPQHFGTARVQRIHDLQQPGAAEVPANVLSYELSDGSRVMIRPSGTEPKLKVYIDTFSDEGDLEHRQTLASKALGTVEAAVREYLAAAGS
jgi:phosphomannomutase